MAPWSKGLLTGFLIIAPMLSYAQTSPYDIQKNKTLADNLEDKAAEAIDDGDMDKGLDDIIQAIALDPSPSRYMNYGSILFGNGVSLFKDSDQQKGVATLQLAEIQLRKAIAGFNPHKDQVYLSQCYFLLGEMYLNAFGDRQKAKEYYQRSAELSDYSGAKEELNKLSN